MKITFSIFLGVLNYYTVIGFGIDSDKPLFWIIVVLITIAQTFFREAEK